MTRFDDVKLYVETVGRGHRSCGPHKDGGCDGSRVFTRSLRVARILSGYVGFRLPQSMGSQYCHALGERTVGLWYRKTLPRKLAKVYEIDSWTPNMELMAC